MVCLLMLAFLIFVIGVILHVQCVLLQVQHVLHVQNLVLIKHSCMLVLVMPVVLMVIYLTITIIHVNVLQQRGIILMELHVDSAIPIVRIVLVGLHLIVLNAMQVITYKMVLLLVQYIVLMGNILDLVYWYRNVTYVMQHALGVRIVLLHVHHVQPLATIYMSMYV